MCCMQVILSSSAHKRGNVQLDDLDFKKSGYDQWASYGQSKTANIWTALEIERRYGSQGQWWYLSFLKRFQCHWHRLGLMLLADPTYASVAVTVLMPAWKFHGRECLQYSCNHCLSCNEQLSPLAHVRSEMYDDACAGLHANAVHPGVIKTNLARHVDESALQGMLASVQPFMKSIPQGAATTVWAATAKQWEGKGGKFLEDCSVAKPFEPETMNFTRGYQPHAYDHESAQKLWSMSNTFVGVSD